jgi:hypothetical protein
MADRVAPPESLWLLERQVSERGTAMTRRFVSGEGWVDDHPGYPEPPMTYDFTNSNAPVNLDDAKREGLNKVFNFISAAETALNEAMDELGQIVVEEGDWTDLDDVLQDLQGINLEEALSAIRPFLGMSLDGINRDDLVERLRADFGEPGVHAYETSCLTDEDLALGYDHCVERIGPALEEELLSQDAPADALHRAYCNGTVGEE